MTENTVEQLLFERKSVRGYLPTPVPQDDVVRILKAARSAPSGANLQPGKFHVLTGKALSQLTTSLLHASESGRPMVSEYSYFPNPMPRDSKAKQRAAGYALYQALGIARRDITGRRQQFSRNYRFFDAPIGIVVTIHKDMGKGCFMDLGMSIMSLFVAAQGMGYATTGIGALSNHADVVHHDLKLGSDELVVCGIALGREDTSAPVNQFRTERDPLDQYATFQGFQT